MQLNRSHPCAVARAPQLIGERAGPGLCRRATGSSKRGGAQCRSQRIQPPLHLRRNERRFKNGVEFAFDAVDSEFEPVDLSIAFAVLGAVYGVVYGAITGGYWPGCCAF